MVDLPDDAPEWLRRVQQRQAGSVTGRFWPEDAESAGDIDHVATEKPQSAADGLLNYRLAKEAEERIQLRLLTGNTERFELRKPRDVLRKVSPPPFAFDDVPRSMGDFAYYYSKATGFDQSGIIVACVTAAASVVDDGYKLTVRPESEWHVSARQWSFLCGGPSAGKSPMIRAASDHIKHLHGVLHERWRAENEGKRREEKGPAPALYTSDTTIPALSERLQGNSRGLLMLTEEFASWIGGIDSGDRGDASKNRGDWLQLRDGGPHQIDRVERGSVFVPNWGVSVLAACPPDALARQMKQMPEDGLIQRFVPCILGPPNLDASGDCREAMTTWGQKLEWAFSATETPYPTFRSLSADARVLFDAEVRQLRELVIATEGLSPAYAAHLGKHPGMLGEVALVFHVFGDSTQLTTEVNAEAMSYAIRYMRKVRKHAYALYSSILSSAPAFELAQAIARSIVAADEALPTISRDWMTQHCQAFKKADDRLRREAVQILEDADWLEASVRVRAYGGWPSKYDVHQGVFAMFAREGAEWRARRAAVRDAIGEAQ